MVMVEDYYAVLDVRSDASAGEIEQAYRDQVRRYHPDLNPANEIARQRFQEIQVAFDVLHNPEKRAVHDRLLGARTPPVDSDPRPGSPVTVDLYQDGELDALRFVRRTPGTDLICYRRRGRLMSLVEWLGDSDFLAPLILVVPFLLMHAVALLLGWLDAAIR